MASSFATIDMSDDFAMPVTAPASASKPVSSTSQRTLLLSPPSLSSHQEKLSSVLAMHDRSSTDMQMLDRLSMGLVSLPPSTYNSVMILSDADGSRRESQNLIDRKVLGLLVMSMKDNATLQSQDNTLGTAEGTEKNEAILAGLTYQAGKGFTKQASTTAAVPLRLNRKPKVNGDINGNGIAKAAGGLNPDDTNVSLPTSNGANGKRKSMDISQDRPKGLPAGVFIDDGLTKNELEDDSDDELIDEDELLAGEDLAAPVRVPRECAPKAKRRRACKDCTCGLAQRLEAEDKAKRDKADQGLKALKLQADDLAEVDFTVPGKVGSCGNCSLGDAFRCDGCPYIGLPAFKPGEEVRLLNNDIQL